MCYGSYRRCAPFPGSFSCQKKTRSVLSPMFTWWIPEIVMWKKIFYLQGWILILVVNAPSSMIRSNFDYKIHDVQWLNPELSWSNSWSATVKSGFWNPYNITCSYIFIANHRIRLVYSTDFKSIIHLLQNPWTPQFLINYRRVLDVFWTTMWKSSNLALEDDPWEWKHPRFSRTNRQKLVIFQPGETTKGQ